MPDTTSAPRPFIIWTLQRTGGTNLAHQLTLRSGLQGTQHEPFNPGRMFGHITEQWMRDGDRDALRRGVDEICQRGVIIKHCVEMVPWEVTEALARASAAAAYHHLFLYRRNGLDRLLSLHFAQRTGVWGPGMASTASGSTAVDHGAFGEVLPVEKLIQHEQTCVEALHRAWTLLQSSGASPIAVAYEDIYRTSDPAQPTRVVLPLLRQLGLSQSETDDRDWIGDLVGKGDQGTRDRYHDFPGAAELAKRVKAIAPFTPDAGAASVEVRLFNENHPWILRCVVDVLPEKVSAGVPFEVGGVAVLSGKAPDGVTLQMRSSEGVTMVPWGLPSQRMAREFPQGVNPGVARFLVGGLFLRREQDRLELMLCPAGGEWVKLAEIVRAEIPDYSRIYVEPKDRLIFDVGGNDGADTWYYLRKGFRVVVVEAVPELADNLRRTLAAQVESGRLVVEAVAIAEREGELQFTVNDEWTEWSSAHGSRKAVAGRSRTISVPCTTLSGLISRHGQPYFVKLDIEGGELAAVESLRGLDAGSLPRYISWEMNSDFRRIVDHLSALGYRRFQLVRQGAAYLPRPPRPSREGLEYQCGFTNGMSGLFGADLPASEWVGMAEVLQQADACQTEMKARRARGEKPGWYDLHAARDDQQPLV